MLDYFADILRLVERSHQQRIFGLDDHQIAYANQRDEFAGNVNVIIVCIQGKTPRRGNRPSAARFRLCRVMLVQRGPGAEIVPSKIGGQAEDARLRFSLGRAGFEDGIVDADVFAFRVELAESFLRICACRKRRRFSRGAAQCWADARAARWPACRRARETCRCSRNNCRLRETAWPWRRSGFSVKRRTRRDAPS